MVTAAACEPGQPPAWCRGAPAAVASFATANGRWGPSPRLAMLWEVGPAVAAWAVRSPNAVALNAMTGVLAVADHSTRTVTFIGPDGQWLAHSRLPDQGPAAFGVPDALDWTSDGRLAVLDPVDAKIVFLRPDGTLLESRRLNSPARRPWRELGVSLADSTIIAKVFSPVPGDTTPERSRYWNVHVLLASGHGARIDTVAAARVRVSVLNYRTTIPGTAVPVFAALGDTLLAIAGDIPELRIRIVDRSGAVVRQMCRTAPPLPLSAAESTAAADLGESETADSLARIGRLFTGTDGRIWAQRNRAAGHLLADHWFGPLGSAFDVHAADGEYLGEIVAPSDVRLVAARGDTVLGLRYRDAGATAVVAFAIRRAP